jgi:hypothetical protein
MTDKLMKELSTGDFETGNIRYRFKERYTYGWTDMRGVMHTTPHEPADMTVAYCRYFQRDTPHGDGICIYHRNGECREETP